MVFELLERIRFVRLYVVFRRLSDRLFLEIFFSYFRLNFLIKWVIIKLLKFLLFNCVLLVVDSILNIEFLFIVKIEILNVFLFKLYIIIFFFLVIFFFRLKVKVVVVGLFMIWSICRLVIVLVFLVVFFWVLLK